MLSAYLKPIALIAVVAVAAALYLRFHRLEPTPLPPVLPAVAARPHTAERTIGASVEGRKIIAYTYGNGPTHVVFVGGMHGGYEWNSVLLANTFRDYIEARENELPQNVSVTVIPNVNPDAVFDAIGKEGSFLASDVPTEDLSAYRFNAHKVDLNRNFDCKWQPKATWKGNAVSAGTAAFSEPEAQAVRDFMVSTKPAAVVFWHSQANAVYASECEDGILPDTLKIMDAYATAAKYPSVKSFDAYPVTGDAEGWLASIGIPAITVELSTHDSIEWERNLKGATALIQSL